MAFYIVLGRFDLNRMKSLVAKIREHPFIASILGVLFIAAVATRVCFLDRSLWLDEAWVANAALAPSVREAIYYDAWLQTAPPLFIVLARFAAFLLGVSNVTLRIVPALSGIVSVVLIAFIAFKLLRPTFAVIAVSLFVFSPQLILYSQALKQYSTDVLCMVALLALGLLHLEKRSEPSFYLALTAFIVLGFLSYPAVVFLPFFIFCALVGAGGIKTSEPAQRRFKPQWRQASFAAAAAGIFVAATNYLLFISPNQSLALAEYFSAGFYQGDSLAGQVAFSISKLPGLTGVFFFHNPGFFEIVLFFVLVVGLISLYLRGTGQGAGRLHPAILFLSPIAGVVALNLLGLYPLPTFDHRLLLFLSPISVLMFCLGFELLASASARFIASWLTRLRAETVENALGTLGFSILAGLLVLFFTRVGLAPFFAVEREQAEEAVLYLAEKARPDDVLYIHASMGEQFKFYERLTPFVVHRVVPGNIGIPCCSRNGYRNPRRESIRVIAEEIAGLGDSAAGRTLWFLVTNRPSHWRYSRRNDIEMFEFGLAKFGCQKVNGTDLLGVRINQFKCAPD